MTPTRFTPSDQGDITPLETWAYNTNNPYPYEKWRVMYEGAQRSNEVLRLMTKAADMTDAEKKATTGEVRFLRGYYHFEVKRIFNYVPYVDETITVANGNGNVSKYRHASGNFIDIWPKIEADFNLQWIIFQKRNLRQDGQTNGLQQRILLKLICI